MSDDWRLGLPLMRGDGVVLREPRVSDAQALQRGLASPHVTRDVAALPASVEEFAQFIAWARSERRKGRHVCFAVLPRADADAVGLVHVRGIEPGFGTAEWGFALAPAHWGTGLFLRGARLALDFIFRDMRVHRLESRVTVGNGRSSGALRKLGAVPEGVLRQSLSHNGRRIDEVLWAIAADDWLAVHPAPARVDVPHADHESEAGQGDPPEAAASWRQQPPVLRGAGVTLRELDAGDAAPLARLLNDPEVMRFIPPPPPTEDDFVRFIRWARQQREAGCMLCMGVVPDGAPAAQGVMQLHEVEPTFHTADWGVALGRPYWGTGLFERSAEAFLTFAFDTVGVQRIEARAVAEDARANASLQRLGATREGRLERSFLIAGEYHDDVLWALLDTDWRQRRPPAR